MGCSVCALLVLVCVVWYKSCGVCICLWFDVWVVVLCVLFCMCSVDCAVCGVVFLCGSGVWVLV